ncbi:hypothetical protein C7455_101476 [Roseicyclus mahoneyensis]|uniref:Uncharacterized protein n=1 Tax=Roseicyclus mahoneyensis TaxID=164332 RepID=A0A316GNU6_9RHOB|nr:hypothetical protein C7455_101476 [Roseicyclus mahoneyensis]
MAGQAGFPGGMSIFAFTLRCMAMPFAPSVVGKIRSGSVVTQDGLRAARAPFSFVRPLGV